MDGTYPAFTTEHLLGFNVVTSRARPIRLLHYLITACDCLESCSWSLRSVFQYKMLGRVYTGGKANQRSV